MRRISYLALGIALLATLTPAIASATAIMDSAILIPRVFDDGPFTVLTSLNNYPTEIWYDDVNVGYTGWANLHTWSMSNDGGATPCPLWNGDTFRLEADLQITGLGQGEAGLRCSPWWSLNVDGRFNVRASDGEIAVFGGRLPFYSFTANHGINYVRGDVIHLKMEYDAHTVSPSDPGTMTYTVVYNSNTYTSGPLPMDMGNLAEAPLHGLYGILDTARVGGYMQYFLGQSGLDSLHASWTNIEFWGPLAPIAVEETTWGKVKSQY
jgi:hypothetical protein